MADTREKTIKAIEKRLKKQPGSPLFARLASYYLEDSRTDDALRVCNEGIIHHPFYTTGHLLRGKTLVSLGKKEEARKSFNTVHELQPGIAAVERMLADVGGPIVAKAPPTPAPKVEEPFVPQAQAEELQSLETLTMDEPSPAVASEPYVEPTFVPVAEPAPVEIPVEMKEETQDEFMARMQQELAGTENTLSLEDYLSGNFTPPPSNDIEDLAGKLQGAKITPVIDLSRPTEGGGGNAGFVTPTLAEIYVRQGWYDDAIKAYRSLAASKPDEQAKFEQRITEIEEMKKQQS